MEWRGDNRGQSVQIGAILLFATLIIALSIYQVTVVPEENRRIEFNAYQDASADSVELRNGILSTAAGNGARGVTVKTGAQYPPRIFLVNGLQPAGTVETTLPGNITLSNVNGSVSEYEGVGEYVQEEAGVLNYSTKLLRFQPDYNQASAADIYVTNGFVYRAHGRPTQLASQALIRGNTITVTTIAGNLDESGYRTSLTAVPVSAHVNTVTVTNESTGPVELTIPTRLNATDWNETVLAGSKTYVEDVVAGPRPDTVTVQLAGSQNYELKVAQLEVKGTDDDNEVDNPDARYLIGQTDEYVTLNSNNRVRLVAESRDAFNNPRSNWPVTFNTSASNNLDLESTSGSLSGDELTVRSNEEGHAAVWAEATGDVNDATVIATLGTDTSGTDAEQVRFTVSEPQAGGNGGGGGAGEAPSIDSYSVTVANNKDITADWSISDVNGDLDSVEITWESLDSTDSSTETEPVNGGSDSGSNTYKGKNNKTYEVTIVVTDANGNSVSETQTVFT